MSGLLPSRGLIGGVGGPAPLIFGFARSFINMGDDGILFKRFLLHDPYNPVSLFDLLRLSLFKYLLFYAFLVWSFKRLVSNPKVLWMCLMTASPYSSWHCFGTGEIRNDISLCTRILHWLSSLC